MKEQYSIIDRDPRFHALQRMRGRVVWGLTTGVVVAYYAFILMVAYEPEILAQTVNPETAVTYGILAGIAVIVFSLLLTIVYVWIANRKFDPLNQQILDDAHKKTTR